MIDGLLRNLNLVVKAKAAAIALSPVRKSAIKSFLWSPPWLLSPSVSPGPYETKISRAKTFCRWPYGSWPPAVDYLMLKCVFETFGPLIWRRNTLGIAFRWCTSVVSLASSNLKCILWWWSGQFNIAFLTTRTFIMVLVHEKFSGLCQLSDRKLSTAKQRCTIVMRLDLIFHSRYWPFVICGESVQCWAFNWKAGVYYRLTHYIRTVFKLVCALVFHGNAMKIRDE